MTRMLFKLLSVTALCAIACLPAKVASSQLLFDLSTTPGSSYSADPGQSVTVGFDFKLSSAANLTALCLYNVYDLPLSERHEVGIWDSTGNLLASALIGPSDTDIVSTGGNGSWKVKDITPIFLAAGKYTLGALYVGDADLFKGGQTTTSLLPSVTLGSDELDPLFSPTLTKPTSATLGGNGWYGPNAILRPASVPEGDSVVLLMAGAVPLALVARRRMKRKA